MSNDDKNDDQDDGYEAVLGFSVPIKRVLGHDERPENPDGSRTGSLFMTIEGCTFQDGDLKGSAAATVGAPTVVVEIVGKDRDYLTSSKASSRYVVSVHDVVKVAIDAHKARMATKTKPDKSDEDKAAGALKYIAQNWNTGHASTADLLRAALDYGKAVSGGSDVLKRLTRLVWIEVGKAHNPLLHQVMSDHDPAVRERFSAWNTTQVELGRALMRVVFDHDAPDLALLKRALDFLES